MSKMVESNAPFGVILCGGEGSRMADILPDGVPKPLLQVEGDDTMLDTVIRQHRRAGMSEMLVVASEKNADAIRSHCRRHATSCDGVSVAVTSVRNKRGLGSILFDVRGVLPDKRPLYKSDCDALHFRFDPQAFVRFHETHRFGSTALMTRWGAWKHFAALNPHSGRIYTADTYADPTESVLSLTGTVIIGKNHRDLVYTQPDTKTLLRSLAASGDFFGFRFAGPCINVNTPDDYEAAMRFKHTRPL